MKNSIIIFGLLLTTVFSCSYNSEDDLTEDVVVEDMVTYQDNVKSIIDNNCISCHSSPPVNGAPMGLTTYQQVRNSVENGNLIARISTMDVASVMPAGGPRLPQNLIDLIIQWETDGFLEN